MSADDDDTEFDGLRRRVLDAIPPLIHGTEWAPPDGGVVIEAVVVMVWMQPDGTKGLSFVPATNHFWSTEGLLRGALRYHMAADDPFDDDE